METQPGTFPGHNENPRGPQLRVGPDDGIKRNEPIHGSKSTRSQTIVIASQIYSQSNAQRLQPLQLQQQDLNLEQQLKPLSLQSRRSEYRPDAYFGTQPGHLQIKTEHPRDPHIRVDPDDGTKNDAHSHSSKITG